MLSYAIARLKTDALQRRESDQQLKAKLRQGGEDRQRVVEGGTWWRFIEMDKAKRNGDIQAGFEPATPSSRAGGAYWSAVLEAREAVHLARGLWLHAPGVVGNLPATY